MKIKATLDRIPGGMMVVPLLLAATINTFFPNMLRIGGFTEALFVNSSSALIALFLLIAGTQINVKTAKTSVGKGVTLLVFKWLIGSLVGLLAFWLADSNGLFLGLAPIAIIAAMTNSNGGLYIALAGQYGKEDDKAAYPFLALSDGPFLTMVSLSIFGAMGFATGMFSMMSLVAVILPLIIGIVIGNLDREMGDFLNKGSDKLVPFFAFSLGMGINFEAIIKGGLSGIFLGIITVLLTGGIGFFLFKWIGWNPIVGASEGSTAGNAVGTPAAIAAANATFAPIAELATVQVAASVVTTAILLPLFIGFLSKRLEKSGGVAKYNER
ncbi:2-keto-3-deoxygluconate permease [Cytobacillus horneckiae]|uniref:2-keto-3-deoxygluconate permease n=1 Tax=Cytobacillus horneckiae TaxID=549687 RepID=A0A2N0ZCH7_9BACI|nr:2-keto-3-deoxygluconate permease [Cytobacillus horneckiae]MBN6888320.1 2-keto-3-deoxygluconate permease [Cytobacillus horneckiae]MCM3181227.1 2-keto-3-deoxygluconate permease [Cytobacillus horneckiae]MEC1155462.1 2-keto-3-deoxygluconate permease [Cytobacillus horneckiae]MED2940622.1 2-keto-3-deoxygluconate permease [Cytobacillus horneckiae]PKG27227.1 2-keto-3-deoxygluconate permease [Cytobacillus horneckiae]